tara:strand:+ start:679 stop:900 length:222 start_codon:yes stop_codon:yes gene_type:complete
LGIARSSADADDPLGRGGTQSLEALPTLRFDLGEAFEQSMQVEGITHRARFQHRQQLRIIDREAFARAWQGAQ